MKSTLRASLAFAALAGVANGLAFVAPAPDTKGVTLGGFVPPASNRQRKKALKAARRIAKAEAA